MPVRAVVPGDVVRGHATGAVEITSQNHGFVVVEESLPDNVEATHRSLFDGSNELLLDAILSAPPGFEILSEDVLSNLRIIKAKKTQPNITDKIDTVEKLKSKTMQIFTLIKTELDNLRRKELPESITKKA